MYARVINGVVLSDKMDEVIELVESELMPAFGDREGSNGMLLLTDVGSGRALCISLWENKDAMLEAETSDFLSEQLVKVLPLLDEAPLTRNYRVSASLRP
ncbi:MAG: hypothetical protein ACE5GX_08875 [Thermoanaerobaculia bacterium]